MGADRPLRVVVLTTYLSQAGAGLAASAMGLAAALRPLASSVHLVGVRDPSRGEEWGLRPGVPTRALPLVGPRAWGWAPELRPTLDQLAPTIVHAQGLWTYPSWGHLRWHRRTRVPYLIAPQGMLEAWALDQSRLKKRLAGLCFERARLRGAACLHALTPVEARSMRACGLRNPICVVPNGVTMPGPDGLARPPPWGGMLPSRAKVLLYLGRVHPKKGLVGLLRAWREVEMEAACQDWYLVLAGWDEAGHGAELAGLAESLGITRRLRFVGPRFGAEKDAALRHAEAFVLPSLSEGLPVAVLEAWSHAKPVLMTPECNIPEGFEARAAIAVAPTPEAIAEGLRRLLALSSAEREAIGRRGRDLVAARFEWSAIARELCQVYGWVLNGGPAPGSLWKD